ncbi:MAG: CocE/NonD family hydrolase [Acidimicrobiales bacterium]
MKDHKVGLVGLSYPGNAALYAASTQPPHLAAIAVGGTYDDGFRNLLRPSGIVNSGFAKQWIKGREDEAEAGGQDYTRKRIEGGDEICAFNQKLRTQNIDLTQRIEENPYFPTLLGLGNRFAPATIVSRIKVPVLLVATWHDEQVGGHVPTMLKNFTGTSKKRFLLTNGATPRCSPCPTSSCAGASSSTSMWPSAPRTTRSSRPPLLHRRRGDRSDDLGTLPFPANRFEG